MRVSIHRKPLLEALELAREAVSKQTTLPILRNVKIKAEPESIYLYTTNLTTGVKTFIREATVIDIGTALCDATKLLSIVRELPDKEITLQTDGKNHLKVECESISFKLISLSEEDFPGEINPTGGDSFPVGEEFFKAISKVRHAASKEESRYNLNVIYFDKDIVATDGHRLSLVKGSYPLKETLIPLEFIPALLRMKRNGSQNISLSRS